MFMQFFFLDTIGATTLNCNIIRNLCQWVKVQSVIDPSGATTVFFYLQTINTIDI